LTYFNPSLIKVGKLRSEEGFEHYLGLEGCFFLAGNDTMSKISYFRHLGVRDEELLLENSSF
jgi:hypothetical protein